MTSRNTTLAETILRGFDLAYHARRFDVAEDLLRALEHLEQDGSGCRLEAYELICSNCKPVLGKRKARHKAGKAAGPKLAC